MTLATLTLQNFRSYKKTTFSFSPLITVFLGPNTSGKTNLLEAVYLLAVGKSFRADKDSEVIRWESEIARIKSKITPPKTYTRGASALGGDQPLAENLKDQIELEIMLTGGEAGGQKAPLKRFLVNSVIKRPNDFIGKFKAVLFWPEDLELVIGPPTLKRRYLDFVLVQVDFEYRRSLTSYEKGIRQRNKVLEFIREGQASRTQLFFWDQLLIKDGNYLTRRREKFIAGINASAKPFGQYRLYYNLSLISEERLKQYAQAEVASATTLVGPHRDDFQFFEHNRDLATFGSRGEQRLAILWLKLAELDYIEKISGERPVLLLDDIFSELDHEHREEVFRVMSKQQTILTTTDRHFLPEGLVNNAQMIELRK